MPAVYHHQSTVQHELLERGEPCLKCLVHLSFRPGFSPVTLALRKSHNRFNGLLFFRPYGDSAVQHTLGLPARWKPLKRFVTVYDLLTTGLKPGVNEKGLLRQSHPRGAINTSLFD